MEGAFQKDFNQGNDVKCLPKGEERLGEESERQEPPWHKLILKSSQEGSA